MTVKGFKMTVKGLEMTVSQYMLLILQATLPKKRKVESVWVEIAWDTDNMYIAKAQMEDPGGSKTYYAVGDSAEEALLELAVEIIIRYPVENSHVEIDIPIGRIVETKTFKRWFDIEKGEIDE